MQTILDSPTHSMFFVVMAVSFMVVVAAAAWMLASIFVAIKKWGKKTK